MASREELISWISEPPHPEKLEFIVKPYEVLGEGSDDSHRKFGRRIGNEIIERLTLPGHRTADSVDVATAALVLINMDTGYELRPEAFMGGVLQAMEAHTAWSTNRGPQSLLAQ